MNLRALTIALLVLLLPANACAQAQGEYVAIGEDAIAYVPEGLRRDVPAPLLVLLHGHGGRPEDMLLSFRDEADRGGVLLLAPRSQAATWDVVLHTAAAARGGSARRRAAIPADAPRVLAAIEALAGWTPVDRRRIGLAGFSDGASYALWLGTREPERFGRLLLFSPGMALLPRRLASEQRLFLTHGRRDRILPFSISAGLAAQLRQRGLEPDFRPFDGDHALIGDMVAQGVDWFVGE
ncbi:alpha/beta hydrolase [Sphingosinicella terrae]|uniref:alpha/beta hydrolase n=1 Tax=Sphingosinicella terrae TaxID=2172047 RepID=UPI0013B3B881|nr:alpha/beta hydrolase-fold protein [Sphingosinicella terrae]